MKRIIIWLMCAACRSRWGRANDWWTKPAPFLSVGSVVGQLDCLRSDVFIISCYFCIVAFQLPTGQHDDRLYLYSVLVLAGLAQPILPLKKKTRIFVATAHANLHLVSSDAHFRPHVRKRSTILVQPKLHATKFILKKVQIFTV